MDDQILQGLAAVNDRQAQSRVVQYFEQLKESENGWKLCAQTYASGIYHGNDHVKFFCLQVLEYYLKTRYAIAGPEDHQHVRQLLMAIFQMQSNPATQDKTFLRNKIAQLFALAFVLDFPHRWPSFFTDILQALSVSQLAVDLYLRILQSIDSEVVDRDIIHSQQENQRNTLLKDSMRETSITQLADSWYQVMTLYEMSNPETTCLCLDIIGKFISWIDIGLIVNDKFVSVLLKYMTMALIRESAADCICEIIHKGMDPVAKRNLVESFYSILKNAGIFNLADVDDGDFLVKLGKLVNEMGISLIMAWQKLHKKDSVEASKTKQSLEEKIPLILQFLGNEDDDVSASVSTFSQEYIAMLKLNGALSPNQRENIESLLYTLVRKMKYDETYNFEHEGEEEAMFQEYRKHLKIIFSNLSLLDSELVASTVHAIVSRTLSHWESMEFRDVEVAIILLYYLGETLTSSQLQMFTSDMTKVTPLQEMMRLLVSSHISCHGHMIVALQYFETVVRYDKFFSAEPQHIPEVLMSFLDNRGFRHSSAKVRSRASYLFSRFIKSTKNHLQNYVEDILKRLHDLLVLNTPDNGYQTLLSDEDQLFLYETASVLIVSSSFPPEKKQALMKQLLEPIATKFESLLSKMYSETNENRQQAYSKCINNAMSFASRASKGFSSQQTMKQSGCIEAFTEVLKIFLQALNTPVFRQTVHLGVRQYLHRMVICLEVEILPFVPLTVENLLKQADAKELCDFIPLMNQFILKFKQKLSPYLQEVFMPFVSTIYQVLSTPSDELDQVAMEEKKMLQRSYFLFLSTIVNNDVLDVLKNQDMQNLHRVLITIIQGAVEYPDPQSQKMCFSILKSLVEAWGGSTGLAGFPDFMYKSIVPACFMAPMKTTFDLTDGQTILALGEDSKCLKSLYAKRGDEFINYLQNEYLPTVNVSPALAQEFCEAIRAECKTFKNYFKSFFMKARS